MRKIIAIILPVFILTACNLPRSTPNPGVAPATDTPANYQNCYFNWATQPLPELSAQVQATITAAGLTGVIATAEAFGENCYDSQTNKPISFSAMETDFRISVPVDNLADYEKLGNLLEEILTVLDGFPTETTPGPQPGYVGVTFQAGKDELHLWFLVEYGKSARALGLHGAALFEELHGK
jgi:hypothetical protein